MPMPIPSAPSSSPRLTSAIVSRCSSGVAARVTALSRGSRVPESCITAMRAGRWPEVAPKFTSALPSRARYHSGTGETPTSISSAVVTPSMALKR